MKSWNIDALERVFSVNIPPKPVSHAGVGQKANAAYQTELEKQKSDLYEAFRELSDILKGPEPDIPSENARELFEDFRAQLQSMHDGLDKSTVAAEVGSLRKLSTPENLGDRSDTDRLLDLYLDYLGEMHPEAEDPTQIDLPKDEKRTLELIMRCSSGVTRCADMLDEAHFGVLEIPPRDEEREKGKKIHRVDASGKEPRLTKAIINMNGTNGYVALGFTPKTDEPLFMNGPKPEDVRQGQLGDCYFLSSLAAIAAQNPAVIREAMRDNRDGTVTVRFYNSSKEPVYVTVDKSVPQLQKNIHDDEKNEDTIKSVDPYAKQVDKALWVQIMEKAYVQSGLAITGGLFLAERGLLHSSYSNIAGGESWNTIPQIIGTDSGILPGAYRSISVKSWIDRKGPYTAEELNFARELREALENGQFVTAATPSVRTHITGTALDKEHATVDGIKAEDAGLTEKHAYTVIDIKEKNGKYYIDVRNPHGGRGVFTHDDNTLHAAGSAYAEGYSRLELRDFNKYFNDVYVNTFDMTAANRERRAETSHIVHHYGESVRQIAEALESTDSFMMIFKNSKEFRSFRDAASSLNKLMQSPELSEQKLNEGLEKFFAAAQKYSEYCEKDRRPNIFKDPHWSFVRYQAAKIAQEMQPVYERNKDRTLKDKWDEFSYSAAEKKVDVPVRAEDLLRAYRSSTNNAAALLGQRKSIFADLKTRIRFYESIRTFAENGGAQKLLDGSASVQGDEKCFAYLQKNANEVGYVYFIREHLEEITKAMREDGYLAAHPKLTETLRAQTANRLPFEKAPVRQNAPRQEDVRQQSVISK